MRALGDSVLSADLRTMPEDFVVTEIPGFEASGEGEHLLLTIEKRNANTVFVAQKLARWAGIPAMGVSYAGLKDRHAVATQRFSVHIPKKVAPDLSLLDDENIRIVDHAWHSRKLPRGALKGNHFALTLRNVVGDRDAIEQRLKQIRDAGAPNYFGEQRFGRNGDNVDQALAMFKGRRVRRDERSILLSAARSEIFNRILRQRIAQGDWPRLIEGDVLMLEGSNSVFGPVPLDEALQLRFAQRDIHSTAAMWGRGELRTEAHARELEASVVNDDLVLAELALGLEGAGLKQERRATRIAVAELSWDFADDSALRLEFGLAAGSYATSVLAELGEVRDSQR